MCMKRRNRMEKQNAVCTNRKKYILQFLLIFFISFVAAHTGEIREVQAARTDLMTLEGEKDVVVILTYDKELPEVSMTDPSGKVYAAESDFAAVQKGDGAVYYYLRNAPGGTWYIDYDKKSNSKLEVHVMPWYQEAEIRSFVMEAPKEERIKVRAEVTAEENIGYAYYIYAVTMNGEMVDGKKELKNGSGTANQKFETEVDISSLPDGEKYYLQMDVVVTDPDETELTTSAVTAESFSVKGHTTKGDGAKLRTVLDYTDSALEIDWSNAEDSCDQWVVGVFQGKDAKEPVYSEQMERDRKNTALNIDLDGEDLKVEVSAMSGGKIVAKYERTIALDPGVTVTINTPEQTGSTTAEVSYDVGDKTVQAEIAVGEKSQKVQWKKSGTAAFEIADMETQEIRVVYGWEAGSFYRVSKRISTDVVPPMLELYGVGESIRVKEKVLPLSGKTDPDAVLKVDGKEQKIGKDGTFQISLKLKKGENQITLTASDPLGNQTSRTILVQSEKDGAKGEKAPHPGGFWILGGTFLAAFLCALLMGIFGIVSGRKGGNIKKIFAVVKGFCLCGILGGLSGSGWCLYRYWKLTEKISGKNLTGVLKAAPVSDLTKVLEQRQECLRLLWIPAMAAAAFLLLLILLIFGGKAVRKAQESHREKAEQKKAQREEWKRKKKEEKERTQTQSSGRESEKERYCPYCGAKNAATSKYCGKCGKLME